MPHAPSDAPTRHGRRSDTTQAINLAFNDFLRLRDIDRGLLTQYRETLSRGGERFAMIFYDYLLAFPATAEVIRQFQARGGEIDDLVRRQVEHLFALLSGDTGEASARRMIEVGEIHSRRGIEPVWMLGAYLLYLDHLQSLVHSSPDIAHAHRGALEGDITRLLFRDMGLALEGYWDANLRDLEREKAKVSELQTQITSLLSNIPQLLWSVDVRSNRVLYVSPSAREVCHLGSGLPVPCWGWTVAQDREKVRQAWRKALDGERAEIESRVRLPSGELHWFRRIFCPFTNAGGKVVRIDGLMEDTTDARQMLHKLRTLATTDVLTGLPNRALFQDRLNQAIRAASRARREVVLMLLDLNHFKEINDTLGHPAGDQVLILVAVRLSAILRRSDTLARLGGDEFAILLPDVADGRKTAERFIKKVMKCFNEPFQLGDNELFLGTGAGVVVYPEHGDDSAMLMSRADVAMYGTKNRDVDYFFYSPALDPNVPPRLRLSGELRHAIERRELTLYYQPKVDFTSRHVTGIEALIRWNHPEHGLLLPDAFLTLAERSGWIHPMTYWAIETALCQCKRWHRAGLNLRVAVNVSGRALRDPAFYKRLRRILRTLDVPASSLEIEITENTLMSDIERVRELLVRLVNLGVHIAIDDFGTGYSSLAVLKTLPLHTLKVDRSFVSNMVENRNDARVVRSTIDLGHTFGCRLIAQGIEDQETWDALSALGCDDGQGFLISRPLRADRLAAWFKKASWGPVVERRARCRNEGQPAALPFVARAPGRPDADSKTRGR